MAKSETMGTPGADPLQVAARVAGQANLLDIRYFRLNAEFGTFPDEGREMDYDLKSDMSCTTQEGGTLVVDGEYRVRIYQFNRHSADQHGESDKTEDIAELSLNLAALYDVGNSDFGSDELAAFTEAAGSLALYPYLRSAVSDLCRAGFSSGEAWPVSCDG